MRMSHNGFIIHFVISLKADRLYKTTVVYNFATAVCSDIPWQTVVYQLYITARGFDVANTKCYISMYVRSRTGMKPSNVPKVRRLSKLRKVKLIFEAS